MVSSHLLVVLLAALASSCSGARMKANMKPKYKLSTSRDDACPKKVKTNTKGDCVDMAGTVVPKSCCDCKVKLQDALHYYQNRMNFLVEKCKVQREDVKPVGGDFMLMDDTRICSDTCQAFEELKEFETLKSWNVAHCTEEPEYQPLLMLHGIGQAMDSAWNNCEALFEPVQPHQKKSVFVIDISGSMNSPALFCSIDPISKAQTCRSMSRIAMVKEQLPKLINGLEEDHQFALVAFASSVIQFKPSWSGATAVNKASAVNWINRLRASGTTMMLRALRHVQARFGDYDAISLLGDGIANDCKLQGGTSCLSFCPAGGCQKPVHTTLFMPSGGRSHPAQIEAARALLKDIADRTGGKFREPFP